ncbi:hypothetical protein B0T13DRAFT_122234 [Neurospora crassa]|nr:hypothetical protein B0T13DRAFT_122234 [Neurospora crassa]
MDFGRAGNGARSWFGWADVRPSSKVQRIACCHGPCSSRRAAPTSPRTRCCWSLACWGPWEHGLLGGSSHSLLVRFRVAHCNKAPRGKKERQAGTLEGGTPMVWQIHQQSCPFHSPSNLIAPELAQPDLHILLDAISDLSFAL